MGTSIDVLCAGVTSFDLVFSVACHPCPDEKMIAESFGSWGGGPAANAAVAVSRLGLKAAFMGYLGRDPFGMLHLEELRKEGVLTDCIVQGDAPTPLSAVIVKPDGARALIAYRSTYRLLPADTDLSIYNPKVILFDGHEPLLSEPLARDARKRGIPVVLDAGSLHHGTELLAPLSDYLVASETFAGAITGCEDMRDASRALRHLSSEVIVTCGDRGLYWNGTRGEGCMPSFKVEAVDTTGAGDAFHGAFAAGLAVGMEWNRLLRFASAAAALCCTLSGARPSMPRRDEVERFLERNRNV